MEKEKLYLVVSDESWDSASELDFKIFKNYENAKTLFDKKVKQYKEKSFNDIKYGEEELDDSYLIWEEGSNMSTYASVQIFEKNLEDAQ